MTEFAEEGKCPKCVKCGGQTHWIPGGMRHHVGHFFRCYECDATMAEIKRIVGYQFVVKGEEMPSGPFYSAVPKEVRGD